VSSCSTFFLASFSAAFAAFRSAFCNFSSFLFSLRTTGGGRPFSMLVYLAAFCIAFSAFFSALFCFFFSFFKAFLAFFTFLDSSGSSSLLLEVELELPPPGATFSSIAFWRAIQSAEGPFMEPSTPSNAASVPLDLPKAFKRSSAALMMVLPCHYTCCT